MSTTMTLAQLRLAVRQRADMVNSSGDYTNAFITDPELNSYINQSRFELYDLLIASYEDYYVAPPLVVSVIGGQSQYNLPDGVLYSGAPAFYKLIGVDLALGSNNTAYATLEKFDFISRNDYQYPQSSLTSLCAFNIRYRLVGSTIMLTPTPGGGQNIRLWYIPRLTTLAVDADTADGISGWTEYIIVDSAIKCGQKEEQDVTTLMGQKAALIKRIEEVSMNRDAGQPDTISNTRRLREGFGYGGPNSDGWW